MALHDALAAADDAGAAGATLVAPDGSRLPSAWRFPSAWTRLAVARLAALRGPEHAARAVRDVDWAPAAALLVRREAAAAVGLAAATTRRRSAAACATARWRVLYVPEARAVHHERPAG